MVTESPSGDGARPSGDSARPSGDGARPSGDGARSTAIEDPTNRWLVHPLSSALLGPAIRAGITPNLVSLTGLGCGVVAAVAYWHWREPGFVLAGFAAMIAWHVFDGLDGKLARATGGGTALGRVLDGACDYLVFIAVEMALVFSAPGWSGRLLLALVAAAAHVVQSAAYEGERAAWSRRAAGRFAPAAHARVTPLTAGYDVLERLLGDCVRPVDAMLAATPDRLGRYLAVTAPRVRRLSLLGANGRTLAIALACLAGHPTWFWWWELVGLSLIGVVLVQQLRYGEALLSRGNGC
ncbi:MAG: CDP-alcohol phosphatidyltransferase family protein [Janthinobacterium lividum]